MAVSLIVDDTSLALMLLIVVTLSVSLYLRSSSAPLLHPLILSRQADVAAVRRKGESAVYRNANSPAGFDLAFKPRRGVADLPTLLRLASGGAAAASSVSAVVPVPPKSSSASSPNHDDGDEDDVARRARRVYAAPRKSNDDVAHESANFARGIVALVGKTNGSLRLCVVAEEDSLPALEAILAPSLHAQHGAVVVHVVHPDHVGVGVGGASLPRTLPGGHQGAFDAVVTTASAAANEAIGGAGLGALVDEHTLFVLTSGAAKSTDAASGLPRTTRPPVSFASVVSRGSSPTASLPPLPTTLRELEAAAERVAANYWVGGAHGSNAGWCAVSHGSLASGVTAHLAMWPADLVPTTADTLVVEKNSQTRETSSLGAEGQARAPRRRLAATASPAGLVLALVALYTGAALVTDELVDDANATQASSSPSSGSRGTGAAGGADRQLVPTGATLLYTTPHGAAALARSLSAQARRSRLLGVAARSKLATLRRGRLTRDSWADSIVFGPARARAGCEGLRGVFIVGEGTTVPQELLDVLRVLLGVPVLYAYLPVAVSPLPHPRQVAAAAAAGGGNGSGNAQSAVAMTAPVSATHAYDLQAFLASAARTELARPHVGAPSVSLELKLFDRPSLVAAAAAHLAEDDEDEDEAEGRRGNPVGEVCVRGRTVAGEAAGDWVATGDLGELRSNGTLVVLRDSVRSAPVEAPTLYPSSASAKQRASATARRPGAAAKSVSAILALSYLALLCLALVVVPSASASPRPAAHARPNPHPSASSHQLARRADSSTNSTYLDFARFGLLTSQRASWEQGTAQSALLELDAGEWSVFSRKGSPLTPNGTRSGDAAPQAPMSLMTMAYRSVVAQAGNGMLCYRVSGDENVTSSSALDPAACGEAVVVAACANGEVSNNGTMRADGFWSRAAQRMLNYVLQEAPRVPTGPLAGAISHRAYGVALWADAVYMGPPFLATFALATNNQTLFVEAYRQVRLYRDALRIANGTAQGLWAHIAPQDAITARSADGGPWATGNGWAAAGMVRVLAAMAQSPLAPSLSNERADLAAWTKELLARAFATSPDSAFVHNYLNDSTTFLDAAGSTLLAYAAFRYASLTGDASAVARAEAIYSQASNSMGTLAIVQRDSVDALDFGARGATSPETLAFAMLMSAARRDYGAANVTSVDGPRAGGQSSGSASVRGVSNPTRWLVALAASGAAAPTLLGVVLLVAAW